MWRDEGYLLDILQAARRIQSFIHDMDGGQFLSNELVRCAVIRQFEIIGEASARISTEFVIEHPEIPWPQMVSMRNRLIHEYTKIKLDVVWEAIQVDIPSLIELVTPLVPPKE